MFVKKLLNLLINTTVIEELINDLGVYISKEDAMSALMDCYNPSWDYIKIKEHYLDSKEYKINPKIFGIAKFDTSIIKNPDLITFQFDECIKSKGDIWYIHKNDKDYFPSSPHAHNYKDHVVLHLGNGNLFQRRKECGKIKRKDLINIRRKVKGIKLPILEI
jgi:hypothetical protein